MLKNGGAPPRMTWVGRSPTRVQEDYARRFGITVTGYVDDVRPYVQDAACYVAPIRTGGGTRLKILDAWAMGKAVVSTSIGCEGLAAVDGENILIRDSATGFAQAVRDVLHDAQLRSDLGRAARNTALQCYDWEVIGASLTRAYVATVADFQQASST